MALPKLLVALVVVAGAVWQAIVCAEVYPDENEYTTDLVLGRRNIYDKFASSEEVRKSASWLGMRVEENRTFSAPEGTLITQVTAVNCWRDGTEAGVKLVAGGLRKSFVTLNFLSERFYSICFTVDLYAM